MSKPNLQHASCHSCEVRHTSLFKSLCQEGVKSIDDAKDCTLYKKNEPVFVEGAYPKGVFCIKSGKIKVFTIGESGKEQIIRIAKQGDVVGFRSLFSEEPYRLSATTLEESSICFIKIEDFKEQVNKEPDLLQAVLKELSKESGERAMFIKTMAQKTVRQRLAIILLVLDEIYKDHQINLSREDLANYVGTATETVIRLLKEFKEEEWIEIHGRTIELKNIQSLVQEAEF
ncbi:MAG: Crp/Fnr family transcriptional regulator [Crocinitomicaceae bacterium]|nr:Crp/Fnr family transcriptional regulator [Crocinitomicaceae bacterium]